MSNGAKEWVSIKHSPNGGTTVTVSLQDGPHSARWSAVTYLPSIKTSVAECRKYAEEALAKIKEAA